jgi:hypothetical protein
MVYEVFIYAIGVGVECVHVRYVVNLCITCSRTMYLT